MNKKAKKITFKKISLFVFMSVLAFQEGALCTSSKNYDVSQKTPPVIFCALDGSGSYDFFEKSKDKLQSFIESIPSGSELVVRLITSDSYADSNIVLTRILSEDTAKNDNPFDLQQKLRKALFINKLKKEKDETIFQILKTNYPKSSGTDIFGFLAYVQEKYTERYKKSGKTTFVYLFTDLQNNVDKYKRSLEDQSLSGINLYVCVYEQSTPEIKKNWRKIFSRLGIEDIAFFGPDEEVPNLFMDGPLKEKKRG